MRTTVSIVEDEHDTREQLALVIDGTPDLRCLEAYADAESALKNVPRRPPDVLLMDLNLPGLSGVECVRHLKIKLPAIKILMLTKYEQADHVFQALRAGADGYLLKRKLPSQLLQAIQEVQQGGAPMSSEVAARMIDYFREHENARAELAQLSRREAQVLEYLAKGYRYKEIAGALGITFHTVNGYLKSIYEKLHVHSRMEAVRKFVRR